MRQVCSLLLLAAFASCMCAAQTSASSAPAAPAAIGHGAFPVKLTKTLDSSKLKDGDAIEAQTEGSFKLPDGTLISKGSRLTGRVIAAKAKSKGDSESQLTIAFETLNPVNGKTLSVKGTVQAVFPPAEEQAPNMAGKASGAAGGGYSAGTGGAGYGAGTTGTVTDAKTGSDMSANSQAEPAADPKSSGVHGFHDLELGSDGKLFSGGKHVKLDSGVRLIVHVDILG